MAEVEYRPFSMEDCGQALALWAESKPGVRVRRDGEDSPDGICAFLERNPGMSFVAVHDGKVVGSVLCGHDGRRGYIYHLAVDSRYRRRGIGRRLLRLSLERLKACNIRKAFLFVKKENDVGEAFYKSLLWQEVDNVKVYSKSV